MFRRNLPLSATFAYNLSDFECLRGSHIFSEIIQTVMVPIICPIIYLITPSNLHALELHRSLTGRLANADFTTIKIYARQTRSHLCLQLRNSPKRQLSLQRRRKQDTVVNLTTTLAVQLLNERLNAVRAQAARATQNVAARNEWQAFNVASAVFTWTHVCVFVCECMCGFLSLTDHLHVCLFVRCRLLCVHLVSYSIIHAALSNCCHQLVARRQAGEHYTNMRLHTNTRSYFYASLVVFGSII